ncbi:PDC sensor domain-containing protein [Pacificibacter sp. AS14]|uniref:PDC sensor domain-containing protein n=1 Tax=Pacificibacter sp. AS14 TaxID=3135785 RepID=UPI0031785577
MNLKHMLIALFLLMPLSAAHGQGTDRTMVIKSFFEDKVAHWATDVALLSAIRVRNVIDGDLSDDDIIAKDNEWRAQVRTDTHPLVDAVVNSDAGDFLRHRVADAGGTITEVFIMDAHGLNVAASSATSDYWQGDEAKHSETFGKGTGAMHVSELEMDASTGVYQVQVSYTITDPNTNEPIGAITVGLIADAIL